MIRNLSYNSFLDCKIGKVYLDLFHTDVEIVLENGVLEEYAEDCVEYLNNLSDDIINLLCKRLICYYEFVLESWKKMGFYDDIVKSVKSKIPEKVMGREILQYLKPHTMIIEQALEETIAFSLECDSDLNPEESIKIIINNNNVLYVGESCDLGAWEESNEYNVIY